MFKKMMNKLKAELKAELREELKAELKAELKIEAEGVCARYIIDMFSDEKDTKQVGGPGFWLEMQTIGGSLKSRVLKAALEEVDLKCMEKTLEVTAGEGFLLSIVDRINSLQVKQ